MRVRRKALALGLLLAASAVCFLLLNSLGQDGANSLPPGSDDPVLERQLLEVQERLRQSEHLNRRHEDELQALMGGGGGGGGGSSKNATGLETLKRVVVPPASSLGGGGAAAAGDAGSIDAALQHGFQTQTLQVPGIHSYLPHLTGHPEHLKPALVLSQGRREVSIVIGVPTIKRDKASYLTKTLQSLITGLNPQESLDCLIVLFIAEPWDMDYVKQVVETVKENFSYHLESGLLEVLVPPAGFYPDLNNLKLTFGDPKDRVKWRTKQNLDYTFLMLYSRPKAMYYVQMEDDVVAKPGYLSIMKTFAQQQKEDWLMLEFSALGFIGKMFKSSDVPTMVEFFLMFHADKPIDWLLDHLLWVKVCNPEKDAKHCQRMIHSVRRRFKPSLFQHIGMESSLKGKVQKLKDKDFGKAGLYRAHVNPPVQLGSSLKTYQKYTLTKAYIGETFFWASNPAKGDIIDFKFDPPKLIEQYLFRSGNADHPGDIFHNTTVELQPERAPSPDLLNSIGSRAELTSSERALTSKGFLAVGRFNENGLAQGEVPDAIGPLKTIRLHVHDKSDAWVILSEIMIKEAKK